jgi:hypothetical protein
MNAITVVAILPGNLTLLVIVALFVTGGLVFYALSKKGDVRAIFSHGRTVFRLEAKERNSGRK